MITVALSASAIAASRFSAHCSSLSVYSPFQLPLSSLFPFVHASLPSDSQIKKTLSPQTVGKNSFLSSFSFFCLFPFNSPALCSLFVHDSLLPPPSPIPDQEELISFFPLPPVVVFRQAYQNRQRNSMPPCTGYPFCMKRLLMLSK